MQSSYQPDDMRLFLTQMVAQLVDDPQSVRVQIIQASSVYSLQLSVAAEDQGKVIGKQGRTARALRTVVSAISQRHGIPYLLDIAQPVSATA